MAASMERCPRCPGCRAMSGLRECPFCGGGETTTSVNRLNRAPSMSGKESAIISVEVHHWCTPVEGQPNRNTITRTGRDMDSAIAAWNRRAPSSITREEVARLVEAAQEARNAIQDAENEEPGSEDWGALCGARLSLTAALAPFTTPKETSNV